MHFYKTFLQIIQQYNIRPSLNFLIKLVNKNHKFTNKRLITHKITILYAVLPSLLLK